jgi:hypothetical protein
MSVKGERGGRRRWFEMSVGAHRVEAARLTLSVGPVQALAKGQESSSTRREARGGRGLGQEAIEPMTCVV